MKLINQNLLQGYPNQTPNDFAQNVQELVGVKAVLLLTFEEIDQPVRDDFENTEDDVSGNQCDHTALDKGVGRQRVNPISIGAHRMMAAFGEREIFALERIIRHEMPKNQRKKTFNWCH
jgi:hypothetical protein